MEFLNNFIKSKQKAAISDCFFTLIGESTFFDLFDLIQFA